MGWKDLVITPGVQMAILVASALLVIWLNRYRQLSLFADVAIFYVLMVALTLVVLKVIRMLFPIREGIYSYEDDPLACYIWNLHAYLCITNLWLQYINGLMPPASDTPISLSW